MKLLAKPVLSGRTTNRPSRQKYYNSIKFSGWTHSKTQLVDMLKSANDYKLDEVKRCVRTAISEAEAAASKLKEYQNILETLNHTNYTSSDIDNAVNSLIHSTLSQNDLHQP